MQRALDALIEWSQKNNMNINGEKTKKMVLGSLSKELSTPPTAASFTVERVLNKLLGVTINCTLKWDDHVATVASKAAKRLWFLKKLKRAGVSVDDLVHYYLTVIRPVLEYTCAVWHPALTD